MITFCGYNLLDVYFHGEKEVIKPLGKWVTWSQI